MSSIEEYDALYGDYYYGPNGCKVCGGDLLFKGDEFCSSQCLDEYERSN